MNDIMKIVHTLEDSNILLKGVNKTTENETKEPKEYYENQSRFDGVFSRYNLPKTIKNGAFVINLDEYDYVGTH